MREIKFRVWDSELKKLGEVYGFDKYKVFASFDRDTDEDAMYELPRNNDVVLMQYIGLLDKKGVEIYEGDIVMLKGGRKVNGERPFYNTSVIFKNGTFMPQKNITIMIDSGALYNCEVIGNIYENLELLK